jgi:hypothetical protein
MIAIKYSSGRYGCALQVDGRIFVAACPGRTKHTAVVSDQEEAIRWLCDRSLRKSKARKLVQAELTGTGPFADPNHPRRLKDATAQSTCA